MPQLTPLLLFVLFLILWGEFVNGWTDAPNAIATTVSTRALSPRKAILMAAILNMIGAFSGTAVATTIGTGIIKPEILSLQTLGAAMVGIIFWSTLAWKYGLPTSESHGLIAGLTGAGLAIGGPQALEWSGWQKVFIGLLFSTFLGFTLSGLIFTIFGRILNHAPISRVRTTFRKLQVFSAAFMAFSHGSNDGQKFIGMFALAILLSGGSTSFSIPYWVIFVCALVMGIGTSIGGWKIIKTMGQSLVKLEPQHGFAAEIAAASAIEFASRFGIPLSTTHTISTSIMGVGAVQGKSGIKWSVAGQIVTAWILTFPVCGIISFLTTKTLLHFFP